MAGFDTCIGNGWVYPGRLYLTVRIPCLSPLSYFLHIHCKKVVLIAAFGFHLVLWRQSQLRGNVPILKFYCAIGFHQRNIGHALTFDVIASVETLPERSSLNTVKARLLSYLINSSRQCTTTNTSRLYLFERTFPGRGRLFRLPISSIHLL